MDASFQSSRSPSWSNMEDDYLTTLALHTNLALEHVVYFLNDNFERNFTEQECVSRYGILISYKPQNSNQILACCGLKQKNGEDDWTPEMDRTLSMLVLRNASNRLGNSDVNWLDVVLDLNRTFMSDSHAEYSRGSPEKVTTVRNASARWYLLENKLVGGGTIVQEVEHMSHGEVDELLKRINEFSL